MKKIVFKIKPGGEIDVDATGFKGISCMEASKVFIDTLGIQKEVNYKPEYFEEESYYEIAPE